MVMSKELANKDLRSLSSELSSHQNRIHLFIILHKTSEKTFSVVVHFHRRINTSEVPLSEFCLLLVKMLNGLSYV